jgi:hypothetical protein
MTQTTYGAIVTPRTSTTSSYSSPTTKYDVKVGTIDEIRQNENCKSFDNLYFGNNNQLKKDDIIFEFPTLPQRVAQLVVRMPCSHPMYASVMQLHHALANENGRQSNRNGMVHEIDQNNDFNNSETHTRCANTSYLIQLLQQYVLPLKLHAKILFNTVLSNHCYDTNTTTLHNYVGDVLCVTYLLYDFDTPTYAEHSVTVQWLTSKLRLYAPTCYQSWVLIHASILRTKPFTSKQRNRIGLSLRTSASSPCTSCFQYIDSIYEQLNLDGIIQASKLLFGWWHATGIIQVRTDQFVKSEMCIIYDDFGPLGPNNSFRGRDIVRVRDITADTMTECLLLYHPTSAASAAAAAISTTNVAVTSSTIREAIEWICIVHEQANKSRPMSVRIPMIRFH